MSSIQFQDHLDLIGQEPKYMIYDRITRKWRQVSGESHALFLADYLYAEPTQTQVLQERYHVAMHLDTFTPGLN